MATVIVIANQKGGTGKTALSVNLAAGLAAASYKVLLIDADQQGSAIQWFSRRPAQYVMPFSLMGFAQEGIHRHLPTILARDGYDYVIIDCPAGSSNITRTSLLAADHVLVPVVPSMCDFDAAGVFLPVLSNVAAVKPGLRVHVAISRKMPGKSRESTDARSAAKVFFTQEGLEVDVLQAEICERRTEVMRAYMESRTVYEKFTRSKAVASTGKSQAEFTTLTEEVICLTTAPLVS